MCLSLYSTYPLSTSLPPSLSPSLPPSLPPSLSPSLPSLRSFSLGWPHRGGTSSRPSVRLDGWGAIHGCHSDPDCPRWLTDAPLVPPRGAPEPCGAPQGSVTDLTGRGGRPVPALSVLVPIRSLLVCCPVPGPRPSQIRPSQAQTRSNAWHKNKHRSR